jgi:hypothetical protein
MPLAILIIGLLIGIAGLRWRRLIVSASENLFGHSPSRHEFYVRLQTAISVAAIVLAIVFSILALLN